MLPLLLMEYHWLISISPQKMMLTKELKHISEHFETTVLDEVF